MNSYTNLYPEIYPDLWAPWAHMDPFEAHGALSKAYPNRNKPNMVPWT